jgi:hypothetical protein
MAALGMAWYMPWNPSTSKVRVSFLKLEESPKVTGRSICLRGKTHFPSTIP